MYLDDALQIIGAGITQRCAVFCLSFVAFAEGFLTAGAFFLSPHELCDLMDEWNDGSFFKFFLFGAIFGTFMMGATSDVSGRRFTLTLSICISFVSCLGISAASTVFGVELALLCLGFGVAGVHVGCRVLLFELIPMNSRGGYTIMMDLFSIIGILSALVWARYLLSDGQYLWALPSYRHWRLFYFVGALFCLMGCFFIRLTPYSPRQMLAHQRVVGTILLLKRLFALNQFKHETTFPVTYIEPFTKVETRMYHQGVSNFLTFSSRCIGSYIVDIFCCPHTILTVLFFLSKLTIFDNIVLVNGLVSQRLLYGGNENISIGQPVNETLVVKLCNFEEPSLYVENIYLALVAIFAVSLLVAAIDCCPRNIIILISTALCGTTSMLLAYKQHFLLDIASSFTLIFFHTVLVVTLDVIILENYPTKYRGTAYGLCKMMACIFSFGIVHAAKSSAVLIFGLIAYLMFVTMVCLLMLRNKNRQPIEE